MSTNRILTALAIWGVVVFAPCPLKAQAAQGPLAKAKTIKCTFSVMAVGTWGKEKPEVQVKPSTEVQEFTGINVDEGTWMDVDVSPDHRVATISFAVGVNVLLYGAIGPFAAALIDRFGVRRTVTLSLTATAHPPSI